MGHSLLCLIPRLTAVVTSLGMRLLSRSSSAKEIDTSFPPSSIWRQFSQLTLQMAEAEV